MTLRINIELIAAKIEKTHKARSAHFYDEDTTEYDFLNRRLNWLRENLQKALTYNSKIEAQEMTYAPVAITGWGYVRYETLSDEIKVQIQRTIHPIKGSWIYSVGNVMARNLKDAVAYIEDRTAAKEA